MRGLARFEGRIAAPDSSAVTTLPGTGLCCLTQSRAAALFALSRRGQRGSAKQGPGCKQFNVVRGAASNTPLCAVRWKWIPYNLIHSARFHTVGIGIFAFSASLYNVANNGRITSMTTVRLFCFPLKGISFGKIVGSAGLDPTQCPSC